MAKKRQGSGQQLFRTKTVGVRLDPQLKYAAELAARTQRRSLSSFIEWAVQEAVDRVPVTGGGQAPSTAWEAMPLVWDVSPSTRLVKLALYFGDLLTYDEQVLWHLIREHPALWRGSRGKHGTKLAVHYDDLQQAAERASPDYRQTLKVLENAFRFDLLEEHFETFQQVAKGELDKKALEKIKPST